MLRGGRCVRVCLLHTTMSCVKTDEPIEMPFGLWTQVLGGARIPPREGAILFEEASPGPF